MTCVSCGAAVHPADEFCRVCGADIPREASSAARLRGVGAVRALRLRAAAGLPRAETMTLRPLRDGVRDRVRGAAGSWRAAANLGGGRQVASGAAIRRWLLALLAAVAVVAFVFLLVRVAARAGNTEIQAARIENLEAALAANERAQLALHAAVEAAQRDAATFQQERDAAQQQRGTAEAQLSELQTTLEDQQTLTANQQQDLKTLSACLNGTAVGLEFARSGRWSAADVALAAVADACKASERLLQE